MRKFRSRDDMLSATVIFIYSSTQFLELIVVILD